MSRLQLEIILGLVLVLATVGLIDAASNREETRMATAEKAQRAQAIEVGADLYEIHCRSCHGANGEGVGELGPALNDEHFFSERLQEVGWQGTLEEYVISSVTLGRLVATRPLYAGDGITVMAAWSQEYGGPLRPDQIRDISTFVMNWEPTALGQVELEELVIPKANADDPETIARGKQVFLDVGCADCHTLQGLSETDTGPDLTHVATVATTRKPELSAEDYIRESVLIPNAYYVEGYEPAAASHACGGILSQPQLDDLVAFLLTQK